MFAMILPRLEGQGKNLLLNPKIRMSLLTINSGLYGDVSKQKPCGLLDQHTRSVEVENQQHKLTQAMLPNLGIVPPLR